MEEREEGCWEEEDVMAADDSYPWSAGLGCFCLGKSMWSFPVSVLIISPRFTAPTVEAALLIAILLSPRRTRTGPHYDCTRNTTDIPQRRSSRGKKGHKGKGSASVDLPRRGCLLFSPPNQPRIPSRRHYRRAGSSGFCRMNAAWQLSDSQSAWNGCPPTS